MKYREFKIDPENSTELRPFNLYPELKIYEEYNGNSTSNIPYKITKSLKKPLDSEITPLMQENGQSIKQNRNNLILFCLKILGCLLLIGLVIYGFYQILN